MEKKKLPWVEKIQKKTSTNIVISKVGRKILISGSSIENENIDNVNENCTLNTDLVNNTSCQHIIFDDNNHNKIELGSENTINVKNNNNIVLTTEKKTPQKNFFFVKPFAIHSEEINYFLENQNIILNFLQIETGLQIEILRERGFWTNLSHFLFSNIQIVVCNSNNKKSKNSNVDINVANCEVTKNKNNTRSDNDEKVVGERNEENNIFNDTNYDSTSIHEVIVICERKNICDYDDNNHNDNDNNYDNHNNDDSNDHDIGIKDNNNGSNVNFNNDKKDDSKSEDNYTKNKNTNNRDNLNSHHFCANEFLSYRLVVPMIENQRNEKNRKLKQEW